MIKNIVFDIGNVILNFDLNYVLPTFTTNEEEQKFILKSYHLELTNKKNIDIIEPTDKPTINEKKVVLILPNR